MTDTQTEGPTRIAASSVLGWTALVVVVCGFFWRARHALHWVPFVDESGHFLGAQEIHRGDVLYRDFIDAHGPVVFMLTQLWGLCFGFRDLGSARFLAILVTLAATTAILFSPMLRRRASGPVAAAVFLGIATAFWIPQSFFLDDYFTIGAACLIGELSLLTVPFAFGHAPGPVRAAIAGTLAPFACFTAYSFGPTALLLLLPMILPGLSRRDRRAAFGGVLAGFLINVAWLLAFADPVGFVVFHILVNQIDYSRYIHLTWHDAVASVVPSLQPWRLVQSCTVLAFALSAVLWPILMPPEQTRWRWIAGLSAFLGVGLLNARFTPFFPDGAFVLVSVGLLACLIGMVSTRHAALALAAAPLLVAACELAGRHASNSPFGYDRQQWAHLPREPLGPSNDPLSERIRQLTGPADRILVVPYNPVIYEWANRPAMRKYHGYLPWEADYARHPWFHRDRDLCVDLRRAPPKIVVYDHWIVWNLYRPEDFMGCALAELHALYRPDPRFPTLWVRKDLLP